MDQNETWHADRQVGHIVLDEDPAAPAPKRYSPQFSAHICCDQTAGWIMMPLGRKVGLDQSEIELDRDPVPPPPNGARASNFLLWQNGWMDQDATLYEGRLGSGHIVLHGDPAPSKGTQPPPTILAHVYCGQTVAHLSYC